LLYIIVSFSCIYISEGSAATQLTCGGIFNNHFIAKCSQSASVKFFLNRLKFHEDMPNKKVEHFLGTQSSVVKLSATKKVFNSNACDSASSWPEVLYNLTIGSQLA